MWPLNGQPYDAQKEALKRVAHAPQGYGYFMEMGLGKTAVVVAEVRTLLDKGKIHKGVVFCPFSLTHNWANEFVKWLRPDNQVKVAVWPDTDPKADVYVMPYESVALGKARGLTFLRQLMDSGKLVYLALDESTQIKNPTANRTKNLLSVARNAAFCRVLSGAPMVQGPQDLWAQLKFIGALRGMSYYQFRGVYCRMGGYRGHQILGPNKETIERLMAEMDRVSFRAKKEDWIDLPPKVYYQRKVEMSQDQKAAYKLMLKDFLAYVETGVIEAPMVITQMGKLQQISSGFILNGEDRHELVPGPDAKIREIQEILDFEIDNKIIISANYNASIDRLIRYLEPYGVATIRGGMAKDQVEEEKRKFNEGDARVIICQETSAKYGHTLLGHTLAPCHTIVFYENTFSLDDRIQMEDRCHRIGQNFSVNVIDFVCSGIEERVIKALVNKKDMAGAIVDAIKSHRV